MLVGDRDFEAVAEVAQLLFVQLLLLMGDVAAFAGLAQSVALDRAGQNDGGLAAMRDGRGVSGVDFFRVMPAQAQRANLVVGEMVNESQGTRVAPKEVLAAVGARLDGVALPLAVDGVLHEVNQDAFVVRGEERVPIAAPDDFDDVPAGAAEGALQLLDDVAVAADGAVEALEIAVDDPDQVVELFAPGEGDSAEAFRLVHFAVAKEAPNAGLGGVGQFAVLKVVVEAGLVDRVDRRQPHRDGRELPEIRHQPWVRV